MAALAASAGADGRIRHVKNADWFRWRYRDPSSRYRFAYFERGGRLVAYLAFHRAAAPLPAAAVTLVDWERDPSIDWTELLGTAIRLADRWVLPLHAWTRALPPEIGPRLPELGFEPRPLWGPLASRRPTFLVGRMGDDAAAASTRDEDGWAVAGRRLDRLDDWNLRPVFADAY
jgi:hypothetical protein